MKRKSFTHRSRYKTAFGSTAKTRRTAMSSGMEPPRAIKGLKTGDTGLHTPPIARIKAYVDTIGLSFRRRPKGLLAEVHRMGCKTWPEDIIADGQFWGVRYSIHQPTKELLRALDKYDGTIYRLDIAFDFFPIEMTTDAIAAFVIKSALMKWRHPGDMYDEGGTTYWNQHLDGEPLPDRNLAAYFDKPSKVAKDSQPRLHLELRLQNAGAVSNEDIDQPSDILGIDPRDLFNKHIRIADFQRHIRRQILDASDKQRTRGFYKRFYPRVQLFKDRQREIADRLISLNGRFSIGEELVWGARSGDRDQRTWQANDAFIEDIEKSEPEAPIIGSLSYPGSGLAQTADELAEDYAYSETRMDYRRLYPRGMRRSRTASTNSPPPPSRKTKRPRQNLPLVELSNETKQTSKRADHHEHGPTSRPNLRRKIRALVVLDPRKTIDALHAELEALGYDAGPTTVASIRADTIETLKIMQEIDGLNDSG